MPLLAYVSYKRRGTVIAHFHQESQYPDRRKGKFIYKALTLLSKQLLLKHDQLQSHKSAVQLPSEMSSWQRCFAKTT